MIPLNWNLRRPLTKKRVTVSDADYYRKTGLGLHSGSKEENVWNIGDPLGCLLVSPCFMFKVNGKLQQLNPGKTSNGPDPSGMKV